MDREIEVGDSWQIDWFERKNIWLQLYLAHAQTLLWVTITVLNFRAWWTTRKRNTGRTSTAEANKKLLKFSRGQFIIANIFMLHVLVLTLADTVICTQVIRDDVASDPEAYSEMLPDIAFMVLYLLTIFIGTFVFVPFLQMLLVTWGLGRFSKKHGSDKLGHYIPEARLYSTYIAQIWAYAAFCTTAFWSPASDNAIWRYVVLQAAIGSALAWLQASLAFCYRFEQLEDIHVAPSGRIRDMLHMFKQTAKVVHTYADTKEALPRYEEVAQDTPLLIEKQ